MAINNITSSLIADWYLFKPSKWEAGQREGWPCNAKCSSKSGALFFPTTCLSHFQFLTRDWHLLASSQTNLLIHMQLSFFEAATAEMVELFPICDTRGLSVDLVDKLPTIMLTRINGFDSTCSVCLQVSIYHCWNSHPHKKVLIKKRLINPPICCLYKIMFS